MSNIMQTQDAPAQYNNRNRDLLGDRFFFITGSYGLFTQCKGCGESVTGPGSRQFAETHDCHK